METTTPRLSVIIPTYNRRDIIRGLLQRLTTDSASMLAVPYEVIVADDRSKDGTSDMIRAEFPTVRLVLGPGKNAELAKRAAIEISKGDYLVNLDDDSMPYEGWLVPIKEALDRGEKIIQAKIVFIDHGQQNLEDESKTHFHAGFKWNSIPVGLFYGGYRPQYIGITHEFGCFVAREVLSKVPWDDHNLVFDAMGESASFYLRANELGYKVFFEPRSVIDHLGALAGGTKERDEKKAPKKECTKYAESMVHNYVVLARIRKSKLIPLLIPYYLAAGTYLSIRQRKNCLKFFARGLMRGLARKFVQPIGYENL